MIGRILPGAAIVIAVLLRPAIAADDTSLARLATCQDSWLDWNKSNPAEMQKLGAHFQSLFARKEGKPFFFPKAEVSIEGLRIVQAFPESVGMGVGFSLMVDAGFDRTRKVFEKPLGPRPHCEAGEGMHSCDREIAEKRTFMVMADDSEPTKTLVGCYYYYER